jgi:hypothetical protein
MPTDGYFTFRVATGSGNSVAFQFQDTGLYYYAGAAWVEFYAFEFDDAVPQVYEIRFDANGTTTLYIDETLVATIADSTTLDAVALTYDSLVEFEGQSTATLSRAFNLTIADLMFVGALAGTDSEGTATGPFVVQRVGSGTDFQTVLGGNQTSRYLLASTDEYLYVDKGQRRYWTPLLRLTGGNVTYANLRDALLIFDADNAQGSTVYRWDGRALPEVLDDAPPVRFGSEHRGRTFAAGDKRYPLRVYFSDFNDPTVWFDPGSDADGQETIDEVLGAGYMLIPGKRGDEVTAVYGEFFGSCVVCTNRGIWRITGSSPVSFARENVSADAGAATYNAVARLGNDLWMAGRQSVTTLQTVQQFGDMQAVSPSAAIANLWTQGISNSSIKVDQYQLYKSSMAWNPTQSLMYFAFAQTGAADVSALYVFSPITKSWYGPWTGDFTFVAPVELDRPVIQTVMHGSTSGKVYITDPNYLTDDGTNYTMTLESPYLTGRSLDPALPGLVKTWRALRVYVQMSGDWDLVFNWQVDDETYQTRTESQNTFNLPRLGTDWRLNDDPDGRIHSNQLVGCIEIPLDVRGRSFKFDVSTADDELGEGLVFQGYEVEFLLDGRDQEQE